MSLMSGPVKIEFGENGCMAFLRFSLILSYLLSSFYTHQSHLPVVGFRWSELNFFHREGAIDKSDMADMLCRHYATSGAL